jgi:hypothetical protein
VVRYLAWLARAGVPKKILHQRPAAIQRYRASWRQDHHEVQKRNDANLIAKIIWDDLLQRGTFTTSSNALALAFFEEHAQDWSHPCFQLAWTFLREYELPPGAPELLTSPRVKSGRLAHPVGDVSVRHDLPERIAAADYALKAAGRRTWRPLIANALNRSPLTARSSEFWDKDHVRDAVRGYERKKKKKKKKEEKREEKKEEKKEKKSRRSPRELASKWISMYRHATETPL